MQVNVNNRRHYANEAYQINKYSSIGNITKEWVMFSAYGIKFKHQQAKKHKITTLSKMMIHKMSELNTMFNLPLYSPVIKKSASSI